MSDIVVIGAGIAGLSAGARLSADARVTVLETETAMGFHASGRSAALFEQNYGLPSTVALNKASADYQAQTACCVVSVGQCNIRARLPAPSR